MEPLVIVAVIAAPSILYVVGANIVNAYRRSRHNGER